MMYNYEDFTEFDMTKGTHEVLPKLREPITSVNLALALNALKARANARYMYVKINKIVFKGYAKKEAAINYTLITAQDLINLVNSNNPLAYEFY